MPHRWIDVTPTMVDATHERFRLSMADLGTPEVDKSSELFNSSQAVRGLIISAARMVMEGDSPMEVMGALVIQGIRMGWYLRNEATADAELERLLPTSELAELREQIRREATQ